MMWLMWMVACGGDTVTSGYTFVGRVLDPEGQPVTDLTVQSIDAQARTKADGRFSVRIKPDARFGHFTHRGVWYRRQLSDSDMGQVIDMVLPPTRRVAVTCPPSECDLELRWPLSRGFAAEVRPSCTEGGTVTLEQAPKATPVAVCRQAPNRPLAVKVKGDELILKVKDPTVRVEVRPVEGAMAHRCRVRIGGLIARPVEPGVWAGPAPGPVTVSAMCEGSPALPKFVDPASMPPSGVILEWVANGPTLDLEGLAPWAEEVVVAPERHRWTLRLAPDEGGLVRLPPLPKGAYRIFVRAADQELPLAAALPAAAEPGVLFLAPSGAGEGPLVGQLRLGSDLERGALRAKLVD